MSDVDPAQRATWELVLEATRSLTSLGRTPFRLRDIVAEVQTLDPTRRRVTIQPTVQGMTINAGTGPPSAVGTPLRRVGHGLYQIDDRSQRGTSTPRGFSADRASVALTTESAQFRRLGPLTFTRSGGIAFDVDEDGAPVGYLPQARYRHASRDRLHAHGHGPFARFRVEGLPASSGLYAVDVGGDIMYIGKAVNLRARWGPTGYGSISPKNCYVGDQATNCKVNHRILEAARARHSVSVWYVCLDEPDSVEGELIRSLRPPWNAVQPK